MLPAHIRIFTAQATSLVCFCLIVIELCKEYSNYHDLEDMLFEAIG